MSKHYLRIVLFYLLLGVGWIVVTDFLLDNWLREVSARMDFFWFSVAKGVFYVSATSALLYFLLTKVENEIKVSDSRAKKINEELVSTMQNISDGFLSLDKNLKINYTNQRYVDLFKKPISEIIGKEVSQVFPVDFDESIRKRLYRIIETGENEKFEAFSEALDCHFLFSGHAHKGGVALFVQDITELKSARFTIEKQKHELELMLNNTHDIIWSIDSGGRLMAANQQFFQTIENLTGKKPETGLPVQSDLFHGDAVEKWNKRYEKAFKGEELVFQDEEQLSKDQKIILETRMNPLMVDDKIFGVVCFARDITAQIKHEKNIQEQNEVLKEISWTVAHEVRGPIATMLGLINLIQDTGIENSDQEIDSLKQVGEELDEKVKAIINKTQIVERLQQMDPEESSDEN